MIDLMDFLMGCGDGGGKTEGSKETRKHLKRANQQKKRGEGESTSLSLICKMGIITASRSKGGCKD